MKSLEVIDQIKDRCFLVLDPSSEAADHSELMILMQFICSWFNPSVTIMEHDRIIKICEGKNLEIRKEKVPYRCKYVTLRCSETILNYVNPIIILFFNWTIPWLLMLLWFAIKKNVVVIFSNFHITLNFEKVK